MLAIVAEGFYSGVMSEQIPKRQIVGVLNGTPDSFSDGGLYLDPDKAYEHAVKLFQNGASMIDIGSEATNPKASPISASTEWSRLKPILVRLMPLLEDLNFSIDTRNPITVQHVVELVGNKKFYVNDVTTFVNPDMREAVAEYDLWAIASHSPLEAAGNIEAVHKIKMTSADDVYTELSQQVGLMVKEGIPEGRIVWDPGLGFGKDMKLNWELLDFARYIPGKPVMIGPSHKRMLMYGPTTGVQICGEEVRTQPEINREAARIAIKSCNEHGNPLMLREHEPEWYPDLIAA